MQGFLELVERDAYAIWWYNKVQRPEVDLDTFDNSYVHDLRNMLIEAGKRVWVFDITSDLGIPTFVGVAHWKQDGNELIEFGSGAHFDARIAMLRTLTELNQFMSMEELHGDARMQWSLDGTTPLRLANYPYLSPGNTPAVEWTSDPKFGHLETREQVNACVRDCREGGPRFPRPQSNAPRHRNAGRPGDRSRIAPLLSPLRARPALRCSRKARLARPAAQGRRSQSDFPAYVRFFAWHLPERSRGSTQRRPPSPPGSAAGPGSKCTRTAQSLLTSTPTRSALGPSAPPRRLAPGSCGRACR